MAREYKSEIKEVTINNLYESKYETRKSNNLAPDVVIPANFVQKIENGITIEELESMSINGLPILTYKTQITIHGIFPELDLKVGNYKSVFTNGNGSLGVKYSAIDHNKKSRIMNALKFVGWGLDETSQRIIAYKYQFLDTLPAEEAMLKLKELKSFVDSIDTSLFKGSINLIVGRNLFCNLLANVDFNLLSIYEKDVVELFLQLTGRSLVEVEGEMEVARIEKERQMALVKAEYERVKALQNEAIKKHTLELALAGQVIGKHLIVDGLMTKIVQCDSDLQIYYTYTGFYKKSPRAKKLSYHSISTKEEISGTEFAKMVEEVKCNGYPYEVYGTTNIGIKI